MRPTNDSWRMDETYVRVTINVSSISTDDRIDSSIRIEEAGGPQELPELSLRVHMPFLIDGSFRTTF